MANGKIRKSVDEDEVWMKSNLAAARLGIGNRTMSRLMASGELRFERDPLDKRIKRVRKLDVERLRQQALAKKAA